MSAVKAVTVGVVGAGAWGTAMANVFADAGADTTIWSRHDDVVEAINSKHVNPTYLSSVQLSKQLKATTDLAGLLSGSQWVVNAIPTQATRSVFKPHALALANKMVINTAKGIEMGTDKRVSEIFSEINPTTTFCALSGPSFALEVGQRLPTLVTVASTDEPAAKSVQQLLSTPYFRTYTSTDLVGVEIAGSLKNVVALASGAIAGLKLGYNAQAALINRGLAEIARLGTKLGAEPMTFMGLSGMGDLVLTCTGPLSRNRKLGVLMAEGKSLDDARILLGGVAEGAFTAKSALELSKHHSVDMPITEQVCKILYEGETIQRALMNLMGRELKDEWEGF